MEAIAVVGVLAVTTAVLLVNNKVNQAQLNLNTDIAGVASAINRAKALTLQGAGADKGICGYGVSFEQGINNNPDTYTIYSYKDCVNLVKDSPLAGQGGVNNLSSGLRILNVTAITSSSQFIKDVVFYSSDAKAKLFNFQGKSICEIGCDVTSSAGIIVINTESAPTSYVTLKIATTGQVTSKPGVYVSSENFNNGIATINLETGETKQDNTIQETEIPVFNEDLNNCIPNCFCATNLPSGQTCSDGCGGLCGSGIAQYACDGSLCISYKGGSLAASDCGGICSGTPHYSCNGSLCIADPNGSFTDSNCNSSCSGIPHYTCNANTCIPAAAGEYTASDCLGACNNICVVNPPNICDGKTCVDTDNCGVACVVCTGDNAYCNTTTKSCETCTGCVPDANGDTCGQCGGLCQGCSQPGYSCVNGSCQIGVIPIRLDGIYPPVGYK